MPLSQCGTPLRGSGKDQTVWKLEWTYTGTAGEVLLDPLQSDQHPNVAVPVADSGTTGITNITFPKSLRLWSLGPPQLEVVTGDLSDPTDYRIGNVRDVDAKAGTLKVTWAEFETNGALADPNTGARARLVLLLERP